MKFFETCRAIDVYILIQEQIQKWIIKDSEIAGLLNQLSEELCISFNYFSVKLSFRPLKLTWSVLQKVIRFGFS